MTAAEFLARLQGVTPTARDRWLASCPAHQDKRPSLSVRELEDGRVLVHCFAGCDVDAVMSAVGLRVSDLFPRRESVNYEPQIARCFHPLDALRALAHEALVVLVAARTLAGGEVLSSEDLARLAIAARRIDAAVAVCHV